MLIWERNDQSILELLQKELNKDMKKELVDIVCCPTCKEDLELSVETEKDNEIISGTFFCGKCKIKYPISEGIPDLLPR